MSDFLITKEANRAVVHFGSQRPVCPYHNRRHDNENMMVRCINNKEQCGMQLYCFRETQGEIKFGNRVFIPVDEEKMDNMDRLIKEKSNFVPQTLPDAVI